MYCMEGDVIFLFFHSREIFDLHTLVESSEQNFTTTALLLLEKNMFIVCH